MSEGMIPPHVDSVVHKKPGVGGRQGKRKFQEVEGGGR